MKGRRNAPRPIGEAEQLDRYAHVLGNVPASVADSAYADAFAHLSLEQRSAIVDALCAELPVPPKSPPHDDPRAFAILMRSLHARVALVRVPGAAALAADFVTSAPIVTYFTTGTGSVTIDQQPPWLHALAGHETAPLDSGRMHHRKGADSGEWHGI